MNIRNEKGMALVMTLLVVTVLIILGAVFILRTVTEKSMADRERMAVKAFYNAEAAGQDGLKQIDTLINTYMYSTVNSKNPQLVAKDAKQYVGSGDGLGFLLKYVKDQNQPQLTQNGSQLEYDGSSVAFGDGTYSYKVVITEKSDPITVSVDIWDFPYFYRIEADGWVGDVQKEVVLTGDFTVRVRRDNFAKYALFTDHHTMESGVTVWFTDKTNFAGPIHTNERFSFALNPSGTFDGAVTQHLSKHRFYNNGYPVLMNADNNAPYDVPTFNVSNERGFDEIVLASSVQKEDLIGQARGETTIPGNNGIYIPNDGSNVTAGIYVKGDSSIALSVDGNDNAVYTVTQGGTTKIITVDILNNQTSVETVGGGTEVYGGKPDGVDDLGTIIYVDGQISSLGGMVQKDTELTISSENDIVITDNLKYSDYTPAVGSPGDAGYVPPSASGTTNLLGLVCWGGDVRIGTSAPDNIEIHGPIMARNGVFEVDNYNDMRKGPRGTATLLGGAITQFYGAFGMFSGSTGNQLSGYGRNFVYDERMAAGKAPPYFPSMKTFIAFTNDITDKIAWQEGDL